MNRAYFNSGRDLVRWAREFRERASRILDVGCGSGLVLEHLMREQLLFEEYFGVDPSAAGIQLLQARAVRWKQLNSVRTAELTAQEITKSDQGEFDLIFSHFSLYLIPEKVERAKALDNIRNCLTPGGRLYLGLPMDNYSAKDICIECFRSELVDEDFPFPLRLLRAALLVPYQFRNVVKPIEEKVKGGVFVGFTESGVEEEVRAAGLQVLEIRRAYGGCGVHVVAIRPG